MATFVNYTDLRQGLIDFMYGRSDLGPYVPGFIALCEAELNHSLRTRRQLRTEVLTLDGDSRATIPADYQEARTVVALTNPRRRLSQVAPDYADAAYPWRAAGPPAVWTLDGAMITVLPRTTNDIEFTYFAKIPALSDAEPVNWLLTEFPNVYLYGAAKHACEFIGDAERMVRCAQMYNGQISALIEDDKGAMWPRAMMRVSGPTP